MISIQSTRAKGHARKGYLLDLSVVDGMMVVYHNKLKNYDSVVSDFHSCDEFKFRST